MKNKRPKPESFDNAVYRLLEHEVSGGMTAFELTRAENVSNGEMIRVLTDIAIDLKERADKRIKSLWTKLQSFHCPVCEAEPNGEYCDGCLDNGQAIKHLKEK